MKYLQILHMGLKMKNIYAGVIFFLWFVSDITCTFARKLYQDIWQHRLRLNDMLIKIHINFDG